MNRRSFLTRALAAFAALLAAWFTPWRTTETPSPKIVARPRRMPLYDTEHWDSGNCDPKPFTLFLLKTPHFQARVENIPNGDPYRGPKS